MKTFDIIKKEISDKTIDEISLSNNPVEDAFDEWSTATMKFQKVLKKSKASPKDIQALVSVVQKMEDSLM